MPVIQPPPKRTKFTATQTETVDTDALLWGIEPPEETPEEAPVVDETQPEAPVDMRPHKCSYADCGKDYAVKKNLNQHVRVFHLKEKKFKCGWDGCKTACITPSNLQKHMCIHTGEKKYKCTWGGCDVTFSQSSNVDAHIRTNHTGEKPYVCKWDGCDQSFTTANCLWKIWRTGHTVCVAADSINGKKQRGGSKP